MKTFEEWWELSKPIQGSPAEGVSELLKLYSRKSAEFEREQCAILVEPKVLTLSGYCKMKEKLAKAIRARGNDDV